MWKILRFILVSSHLLMIPAAANLKDRSRYLKNN